MVSPAERIYIIRDRVVARGPDRGYGPYSLILTCPSCGTAGWARIVLSSPADPAPTWRSYDTNCERCPQGPSPWFPAGSLFPAARLHEAALGAEFPWASCLPGEILAREALLHLAYPVERIADVSND